MDNNIGKALLIVAGMMLAVMILSLLVLNYNEISNFFNTQSEMTRQEQLAEFNKEFLNYDRKNLRGTEVLTLINKVLDYNERYVYDDEKGFERVLITINMKNQNIINQFKYAETDNSIIEKKLTNNIASGNDKQKDRTLRKLTLAETNLIQDAKIVGINRLSSTKLQKLSADISNIIIDETNSSDDVKLKRTEKLTNILGNEFIEGDTAQLKKIKEIVAEYYQYTQFKRAHFDCEKMAFDENTARVCEIVITVKTENNNGNETVVFN